ncbi:MAG: cell filamentation protein Fic [Bacteroidetes bacterium GWF2_41_31]|nr:MAG: cell filamentation protein Fic [Bacteroidetes bacterium GWF2_41_31]OFZ05392.1 MAG: cell filamentation protein Fic [Bacteroidetes bacterium RIFOXYB12_FULL_41_6]
MELLKILREEKSIGLKGGIYHQTQIKLAYNTNRIEGSKLSEEQTRYIYETNTIFIENGETTVNVDDIVETVNHFSCFDYMLDIADEPISEEHIKRFHYLLKINTSDSKKSWFRIGDYKLKPNIVGGLETSLPSNVPIDMKNLIEAYLNKKKVTINDIIDFHYEFENIHPFQDGNGRVGRLIIFKECLANDIIPFIIEDDHKFFYYRGLSEYLKVKGYLTDTCLSAQDKYKKILDYFLPKS